MWSQHSQKSCPDFPHRGYLLQLIRCVKQGVPRPSEGQISTSVSRVFSEASSWWDMVDHLSREASRRQIPTRRRSHLSSLLSMWRRSSCTARSIWVTQLLILTPKSDPASHPVLKGDQFLTLFFKGDLATHPVTKSDQSSLLYP